uniref:Uncharacterized protein n=1 Tax=Rhizophora mucronata TaxID=61149 RepID=A0A2P2N6W3_RHIMU
MKQVRKSRLFTHFLGNTHYIKSNKVQIYI